MQTGPLVQIGRYEVKDKVASGGMATVYRAVQTGIGGFRSVVALKVLHPHLAREDQFRKMFLEEARIGALLQHRNLLPVLDYGEEEGVYFLVTEYFPSDSLEQLIKKAGKIPLQEALYILAEVADGLGALHEARDLDDKRLGLIHRDISPQNVLVGTDGRLKLIDYGIVKKDDPTEETRAGVVKGKCRYMSPEQAGGEELTPASDIYALGVVLVRMLSGKRPHGEGSTGEIMARARTGLDPEGELKRLKLPENVRDIIQKMLEKEPGKRHKNATEVVQEARKALSSVASPYDMHSFQGWLTRQSSPRKKGAKGARKSPAASGKKGDVGTRHRSSLRAEPSYMDTRGIHPKWVFFGLAGLFGVALMGYLISQLVG
mgnify:CR=1 FL=1